MANVKFAPAAGSVGLDYYYSLQVDLVTSSKTEAVFVNGSNLNSFTVEGRNLKFEDGVMISGTIEKVIFEDFEHAHLATIRGEFNAAKLGLTLDTLTPRHFINQLLNGDDQITGSGGDDYIEGRKGSDVIRSGAGDDEIRAGAGNDRMSGGDGSDVFWFDSGADSVYNDGHDIITDFDANGGGSAQDYLVWDDVVDIRKSGKNTIVEYGDGDTVTLLDVKRSEINADDFHY